MSGAAEVAEPLADKEELLMLLLQKGGCVRGDVISRGEVDEVLGDPPRIDDMLLGLKFGNSRRSESRNSPVVAYYW